MSSVNIHVNIIENKYYKNKPPGNWTIILPSRLYTIAWDEKFVPVLGRQTIIIMTKNISNFNIIDWASLAISFKAFTYLTLFNKTAMQYVTSAALMNLK